MYFSNALVVFIILPLWKCSVWLVWFIFVIVPIAWLWVVCSVPYHLYFFPFFRSTPKSRPNNMGQMSVRTSVRPSTKSFSDSDEIWYVGRGRWVMHEGMPYDPIQGQGQGHETFKVRNSSSFFNFQNLSPPAFLMWASKWPLIWNYGTISKFCTDKIFLYLS